MLAKKDGFEVSEFCPLRDWKAAGYPTTPGVAAGGASAAAPAEKRR